MLPEPTEPTGRMLAALADAERCPLFRCTGGWRARSGDFLTNHVAEKMISRKWAMITHGSKFGPRLEATIEGKAKLVAFLNARRKVA